MSMTVDETRALFHRLEIAMNDRRLGDLDAIVAADFVRHSQATPQLAISSLEQFKDFLTLDAETFPDNTQSFRHLVVEGDMVGFWATYQGTQTGQMGPFPPTGKHAEFEFAGVARLDAGKLAELWVTWDNMSILGQLGHLPSS